MFVFVIIRVVVVMSVVVVVSSVLGGIVVDKTSLYFLDLTNVSCVMVMGRRHKWIPRKKRLLSSSP